MLSGFYRAFEDKYRGSREVIKKRLSIYLPFVEAVKALYPGAPCLDLGCGRGEWLEFVNEMGLPVHGVDLDKGMLEACRERGLCVEEGDAIQFLKSLPDESQAIVSGFHIAEHLPFDVLQELVEQAFRVLKPDGLLILETPNPENIVVGSSSFYLDPSHNRPIPSGLLVFLAEFYGFSRCKVLRLQESAPISDEKLATLDEVLFGVSPDYSVVAQKHPQPDSDGLFVAAFEKSYGVSISDVLRRFDARMEGVDAKLEGLRLRAEKVEMSLDKLCRPFRFLSKCGRKVSSVVRLGSIFRLGSGVYWSFLSLLKRVVKPIAERSPFFRRCISRVLSSHPGLKRFLIRVDGFDYGRLLPSSPSSELLVDVSNVYTHDLRTGIQRVVRAILEQIGKERCGLSVRPIHLTDAGGYWHYRYVEKDGEVVVPKEGDVFLGLDLNSNVVGASDAGLFADWRGRGAKIAFVVYDVLPIKNPEWWPVGVATGHEWWLKAVIDFSDKVICISKAVQSDVEEWAKGSGYSKSQVPSLSYFHLGADLDASQPTFGIPESAEVMLSVMREKASFLMVGTIEPRKGHAQVLDAFEQLWQGGQDVILIIFGKQGWMVDGFVEMLRSHSQLGRSLFWVEGGSDEYLEKIYAFSTCLIAASYGEGFGLPLIEAAQHNLPIIARDIPVFREVAGEYAYYFKGEGPASLYKSMQEWISLYESDRHPRSSNMPWLTWNESAAELVALLS